jgi:hypothetical protein
MADKSREENKEYILKTAKEHDVKFIFYDLATFLCRLT